jgi:S1-C subfamily serine protease
MKRTLVPVVAACLSLGAYAQNVLTGKEIYRINCGAVVQIQTKDGTFEGLGVGFITSADGIVMTANHVVTTRDSKFRRYVSDIKVWVNGKADSYPATPIANQVSDDQANYDAAVLKIAAPGLPHVTIGNWSEIEIGDPLIIIPSYPGIGCIMLNGIVALKGTAQTDLGPKPVNTVLFQAPVRNGFSGAPIFNSQGHVVGIVDTKVFGISQTLGELENKWRAAAAPSNNQVLWGNINIPASFLEIITNLDQNLISGLGTGIDVSYANQQQEEHAKQR